MGCNIKNFQKGGYFEPINILLLLLIDINMACPKSNAVEEKLKRRERRQRHYENSIYMFFRIAAASVPRPGGTPHKLGKISANRIIIWRPVALVTPGRHIKIS